MLTINCTTKATQMNDPTGDARRAGVDFTKLPVTGDWQWVSECREVRLHEGRLEVRTDERSMWGPRTLSHALRNPAAPLSHARMLDKILRKIT